MGKRKRQRTKAEIKTERERKAEGNNEVNGTLYKRNSAEESYNPTIPLTSGGSLRSWRSSDGLGSSWTR